MANADSITLQLEHLMFEKAKAYLANYSGATRKSIVKEVAAVTSPSPREPVKRSRASNPATPVSTKTLLVKLHLSKKNLCDISKRSSVRSEAMKRVAVGRKRSASGRFLLDDSVETDHAEESAEEDSV